MIANLGRPSRLDCSRKRIVYNRKDIANLTTHQPLSFPTNELLLHRITPNVPLVSHLDGVANPLRLYAESVHFVAGILVASSATAPLDVSKFIEIRDKIWAQVWA